jgi:hypothetical protein
MDLDQLVYPVWSAQLLTRVLDQIMEQVSLITMVPVHW